MDQQGEAIANKHRGKAISARFFAIAGNQWGCDNGAKDHRAHLKKRHKINHLQTP